MRTTAPAMVSAVVAVAGRNTLDADGGTPDGGRQPFSLLRDSVGLEPRWMMGSPNRVVG